MTFPVPEPGMVISFSYLWRSEAEAGRVEGLKDRPCAIVLVVREAGAKSPQVAVVPLTHSTPRDPRVAIEIPPRVKRHLGLDSERSWIVLDEMNVFRWPGFDLRPVPGHPDRFHYGFLPPRLFDEIKIRILRLRGGSGLSEVLRDDG